MPNQPRPENRHRMVRVEDDLWEAAKQAAAEQGTTRAAVMREALRRFVAEPGTKDARAEAVLEFVNRQSVEYRKHSGRAITEDMALAVREFGVPVEAFYPDDPSGQAWLRAAVAERDTPTDPCE